MSKAAQFPEGTKEAMEILLQNSLSGGELRRVQSVLLGAQGLSSLLIAPIVGHTPEYVRKIWKRYRNEGEDFLLGEKRGSGRGKANLTLEEESLFLAPFIGKAKEAGILIVTEVHEALRKKIGKDKLHRSVTYNLLHRHGWRKIIPRPSHPKSDPKVQEAFKDSFPPGGKKSDVEGKKEESELSGRVSR